MITVNAIGDACPLPVVKTINAIKTMDAPGDAEVLVDNMTAVENLKKLAANKGYGFNYAEQNDGTFKVVLNVVTADPGDDTDPAQYCAVPEAGPTVIAVTSDMMGTGDEKLGKALMKSFIFAVLQLEVLPKTILFYNGGARLTCEGSDSLEDIIELEKKGVEILTCGTCLNFYGLAESLKVGSVTNMYSIVETLNNAGLVIRP